MAEPAPSEETDDLQGMGDGGDFVEHLKDLASEAPVIHLVNAIIGRVTDLRASDIHLEPFDDGLHVRYRIDGVIHPGEIVPARMSAAVNSRVKLLAHLDIAERRLPQDGRVPIFRMGDFAVIGHTETVGPLTASAGSSGPRQPGSGRAARPRSPPGRMGLGSSMRRRMAGWPGTRPRSIR